MSAYGSLLSPCAVKHDCRLIRDSFDTIIGSLILVQICRTGVLGERCYQRWAGIAIIKAPYAKLIPRVQLPNGVPSRWKSSSAMRLRTLQTGAVLGGSIFAPLVHRLEIWAKTFYGGWDLNKEELK